MRGDAEGDVVLPAVEVRDEADNLRFVRKGPREPERHQRRLRAGAGEADPFGRQVGVGNENEEWETGSFGN